MTYEQFIEKIKKSLNITFTDGTSDKYNYKTKAGHYFVVEQWVTGGDWGGNCWDEVRVPSPVSASEEPELTEFDDILLLFYSDISFLKYKDYAKLIAYDDFTQAEYYGNYTTYGTKKVSLE